jgi:hypothetical protein
LELNMFISIKMGLNNYKLKLHKKKYKKKYGQVATYPYSS